MKSLEEYNKELLALKEAQKLATENVLRFTKELPKEFTINDKGIIVENALAPFTYVEMTTRDYMGNEGKNYRVYNRAVVGTHENVKDFVHDLYYIIFGIAKAECGIGEIPYKLKGLDFEEFNTKSLKVVKLSSTNFISAFMELVVTRLASFTKAVEDYMLESFEEEDMVYELVLSHIEKLFADLDEKDVIKLMEKVLDGSTETLTQNPINLTYDFDSDHDSGYMKMTIGAVPKSELNIKYKAKKLTETID